MPVTSREELKDYCLRRLGEPVIKVNADDDQLEDRIDDALEYFQDYHHDATERVFVKHTITADDITNKYIPIDSSITTVVRVLPISNDTDGMYDPEYQLYMSEIQDMSSFSMVDWYTTKLRISSINSMMGSKHNASFKRHKGELRLFIDWETVTADETVIVVECYKVIDPDTHNSVYDDRWLKKYTAALFRRQWGENLRKLKGVQLPGGVELNGQEIYSDAVDEISELEREMLDGYSEPVDFMVG